MLAFILLACAQTPPEATPLTACLWTYAPVEETALNEWQIELSGTLVEAGQVDELVQWELPSDDANNFGARCVHRSYSHGVVLDDSDGQRWWLGVDASETGLDTSSSLPGSEVEVDYQQIRESVAGNIIRVLVADEEGPLFGGTDDLYFDSPVPGLSVALGQSGEQRYRSSCLTWVDVGLVFQGDSRVEIQPQSGALIQVDGVSFQAFVPVSRQVERVRCTEMHLRRNQWFVARSGT